jgi:hypothetical protein
MEDVIDIFTQAQAINIAVQNSNAEGNGIRSSAYALVIEINQYSQETCLSGLISQDEGTFTRVVGWPLCRALWGPMHRGRVFAANLTRPSKVHDARPRIREKTSEMPRETHASPDYHMILFWSLLFIKSR